jgi:uncharacterized protein GlcG (DUF336 family)
VALRRATVAAALAALAACGGGGGEGDQTGCRGDCAATPTALDVTEVERVVRQSVHEAQARGALATVAVVDRVGNVLAVFQMTGAATSVRVGTNRGVTSGLEGAMVPAALAAIAKAITGAYLSSEGNAFSSRTASQIVQENFNPGERNSPSGPLFGVQFSSLTCSDVVNVTAALSPGPKGTPLGLSADPGGLPLYKSGTVVGGVGVIADGAYGLDPNIFDVDQDLDELIAVAGARGFDAPVSRRAERITADGRAFRYTDSEATLSDPASAPAFAMLPGGLLDVPNFFSPAAVRAGRAFGTPESGYRPATDPAFAGLNAFVLDNGSGTNRFPPMAGSLLTQAEVETILVEALRVANRTRAQIRQPLGSAAQVSISVVDIDGTILGLVRTRDGPVFGTDVAVQKARAALQFSHPMAAIELAAIGGIAMYVSAMQALIPNALTDGTAYSARTLGNLARPFLPDGINGSPPGPLSRALADWSPFSTGLQLDLVAANLLATTPPCTGLPRAPNGIQIFPGGFPIFRGAALVGAIGISGDGVDQDDLVAFLGLANAGARLGTGVGNAPIARRADQIAVPGGQLRYAGCPIAPFLDTTSTDVCSGL